MFSDYAEVFTPGVVARIRASLAQAPFCGNVDTAMIGSGVVWGTVESGTPRLISVNG